MSVKKTLIHETVIQQRNESTVEDSITKKDKQKMDLMGLEKEGYLKKSM